MRRSVTVTYGLTGQTCGSRQKILWDKKMDRQTLMITKSFINNYLRIIIGGESGIRSLAPLLESVSYRFHNATVAVNASDAVAHCTPLHAA